MVACRGARLLLLGAAPVAAEASRRPRAPAAAEATVALAAAAPDFAVQLPYAWLALGTSFPPSSPSLRRDRRLDASLLSLSAVDTGIAVKVNDTGTQLTGTGATTVNKAVVRHAKQKLTPRSWWAITFSFAFVVKTLCMLSNVAFQVSPIPQVRQFSKMQDTGEVDAAPFISILYGGCQWCFYGFFAFLVTKKSGFLVLVYSNFAGAFLGIYYVYGFQCNCHNSKSRRKLFLYYKFVCTLALLQAVAMVVLERQQALFFSGLVSSICSVVGACSLLATLPTVLSTGSSASINVPLLSVGIASGCLWLCCGFILWDAWIAVPNLICLVVQLMTVAVVLYFPRELPPGAEAALPPPPGPDGEEAPTPPPEASPTTSLRGGSGGRARARDYGSLRVLGETGGTF